MRLRVVEDADLGVLYEQQSDRAAAELAGVPARERPAFDELWGQIRANPEVLIRVIDVDGQVGGYIFTFVRDGQRLVGYCLGREFWGRGLATRALAEFVALVHERPLGATVAPANAASVRVLEKNGFRLLRAEPESLVFQLV